MCDITGHDSSNAVDHTIVITLNKKNCSKEMVNSGLLPFRGWGLTHPFTQQHRPQNDHSRYNNNFKTDRTAMCSLINFVQPLYQKRNDENHTRQQIDRRNY